MKEEVSIQLGWSELEFNNLQNPFTSRSEVATHMKALPCAYMVLLGHPKTNEQLRTSYLFH